MLSAETCDALEEIAEKLTPALSEHANNISLNEQLFARVKAVYDKRESLQLTPEERRLLENHTTVLFATEPICLKKTRLLSES